MSDTPPSDFTRRAIGLAELGNSPETIRRILEDLGAMPDQVNAALSAVAATRQRTQKRQSRNVWLALIPIGACLVLAGVWFFVLGGQQKLATAAEALPATRAAEMAANLLATPLAADVIPTKVPTPGSQMSAGARTYFDILWNLEGSYSQKGAALGNAAPPAELDEIHSNVLAAFQKAGAAQDANAACNAMKASVCGQASQSINNACQKQTVACISTDLDYTIAANDLRSIFTGEACAAWEQYYESVHERWPYGAGRCKYP